MSCSPKTKTLKPGQPLFKHSTRWSDLYIRNKNVLNNVVLAMKLQSLTSAAPNPAPASDKALDINRPTLVSDRTSLLSDELLLQILSRLPHSQNSSNFLVSKRWLNLQGRLVRSLKLHDWNFLVSGRLFLRFPNLTHLDLVQGCLNLSRVSGILLTHKLVSLHVDSDVSPSEFIAERNMLPIDDVDSGLKALADRYPNLRRLKVINASEMGLLSVAEECPTLQDLELHRCSDHVLRGIAACQNLQILKLIGRVDGFYRSLVSDIGLTILAQGCVRLVKLELSGCEGSFDGIKAIGQCCQMLEELTLTDHRMDGGWLAALSYCENLKKLKMQSCKRIDSDLAPDEHLGSCPTLECLHLERCQLRDKRSMRALFVVCENVKELSFLNCWGLEDDVFSVTSICREVKLLSIEGCSLLTVQGLENVVQHWMELETLRIVSCNRIKDSEVSPSLSAMFDELKELRWWPDTKSMLVSSLSGTEMTRKRSSCMKFYQKLHQIL